MSPSLNINKSYATRVIVALDPPENTTNVNEWLYRLHERLSGYVGGWKVGWPLLLGLGVGRVREFLLKAVGLRVLDLKLADIGYVMKLIVSHLVDVVDAVIAHSFIGAGGALLELKEYLEAHGARLVLVYTMSHPGATEVIDKCIDRIDNVVASVRPWGLVAPATRPEMIRRARKLYNDVVILSPGVGVQGARPGSGLCAGADYEIVGRSIVASEDPLAALAGLSSAAIEVLNKCERFL